MSGTTRVWPCTVKGKGRENEAWSQSAPNYAAVSRVVCSVPKITKHLTLHVPRQLGGNGTLYEPFCGIIFEMMSDGEMCFCHISKDGLTICSGRIFLEGQYTCSFMAQLC